MFTTFMRSATARLAAKLAQRPKASADTMRPYDPKMGEGLFVRLEAFRAQDRKVLGHIRRVLGKARKRRAQPEPSIASPTSPVSEIPSMIITDETGTHSDFDPTQDEACVQTYQYEDLNFPYPTRDLHDAAEGEGEPGYETDEPTSAFSDDSSDFDIIDHQDLASILEESGDEWESSDSDNFSTRADDGHEEILSEHEAENEVPSTNSEAGEDTNVWIWSSHADVVTCPTVFPRESRPQTTLSPSSIFFFPSTPASTLTTPTPSEGDSGPSTPRDTSALVPGSISYEDALFADFKEIIEGIIGDDEEEWNEPRRDAPAHR
ncbi:hypothetical protein F5148DRAFT_248048 [Russula earlei]|uniref:Uncharacterized protein n=1 Tax=Russula earlei TaxID=71964 RepID=A0ACC0UJF0_9AGAM|nr:hypothetical protein F5148DRAFT_248048 [Russula earlei]